MKALKRLLLFAMIVVVGCTTDDGALLDKNDASVGRDGGTVFRDGGVLTADAGAEDTGVFDAGQADAGEASDAGDPNDAGFADAGPMMPDGGPMMVDAGPVQPDGGLMRPDAGFACGPLGLPCATNADCPGWECSPFAFICLPPARGGCGGFANAQCPVSAPICMYFQGSDFGSCFITEEQRCVCAQATGRQTFPSCP